MIKLLSSLILVLSLVLFPPAALAVVSNNAVPGDATYPIKRGLEDVIYAVVSINPNTKAMFAKARSDRRFQEITVLLTQGKKAGQTLSELVEQTQTAADQIDQVSDPNQKVKLISQLSDSITKYDQGLSRVSQSKPQVKPAPKPKSTPLPSASYQTPKPSISKTPSSASSQDDIDQVREELERIKRKLAEVERQMQNQNVTPTVASTPTPISTPTPTSTPSPTPIGKNMPEAAAPNVNQSFMQLNQVGTQSGTTSSQLE